MNNTPQFTALIPAVLDRHRVTVTLTTTFSPVSNVIFNPDPFPHPLSSLPVETDLPTLIANSPYPNVELTLLNTENQAVSQITIIEHQEPNLSLTLHIRQPQPGHHYTARAEMIYHQQTIQTLSTQFVLSVPESDDSI